MARRTVHIPDDLDEQVLKNTTADDSYSALVQEALRATFVDGESNGTEVAE